MGIGHEMDLSNWANVCGCRKCLRSAEICPPECTGDVIGDNVLLRLVVAVVGINPGYMGTSLL